MFERRHARLGETGIKRAGSSTQQNFGGSAPFALGVEEELLLLDSERAARARR